MKPISRSRPVDRQSGYALILMVLALMGIGGVVLTGFTQEARVQSEHQRYLHNERVLREAKQALLMYAYNYTVNNPARGPGRLPCPDTTNNGSPDPLFDCENGTGIVGRFPYNAPGMNFYESRDASGEVLWYGVSSNFANSKAAGAVDEINASTAGTITIHDQSGRIMFDNSIDGVAAVIIAPGPEIDRNGVAQDRAADINDPVNFLDIWGAHDNSDFDNAAGVNGFILGPVTDANGVVIVNDQLILVTSEEVTAMAEKAVLEQYRAVIDAYQVAIWGGVEADYRYPWANAYASITDLNIYDVTPGTVAGRVPYLNFYTDRDSHTVITDMSIVYDVEFDLSDTADINDPTYLAAFNTAFAGGVTVVLSDTNLSFSQVSRPGLVNNTTDDLGAIVGTSGGSDDDVIVRFFWDGCGACTPPVEDGWEVCAPPATSPGDCARDPAGTAFMPFTGDWDDHADIKIRRVELRFEVDSVFEVGMDFSPAPAWNAPTAPTAVANARREAVIDPLRITDLPVDVNGSLPNDFIEITVASCEQDNLVGSNYNAFYLGNDDVNTTLCGPILDNAAVTVNQFDVTTDYYPELPEWVRSNRWNDSILLAYADDHKPGGAQNCTASPPCLTVVDNFDGIMNDRISLLVGSSMLPLNLADLATMFEGENADSLNAEFSAHPLNGNDVMLIMEQN